MALLQDAGKNILLKAILQISDKNNNIFLSCER